MRLIDADKLSLKLRYMGYMDENEEVQEIIDLLSAPTVDAVSKEDYDKMKDLAEQYKFEYECIFEAHKEVLNEVLPNRVEVVRCKDCTIAQNNRYNSRVDGKCSVLCEHVTTEDGRYELKVFRNADDFCSYGERREE